MNTITLMNDEGNEVTYTQHEVQTYIRQANNYVQERDTNDRLRFKVRDFFSEELDWSNGDGTVERDAVYELLQDIGANRLQVKWSARVTIEATVSGYIAEDEDDASNCIGDDISIDIGSGADITIESVDVVDIEEEE
jgi:hypothetical protein